MSLKPGLDMAISCIDNVCCLQVMAQKYLSNDRDPFYCRYEDFRKAIDMINHTKLKVLKLKA